MLFPTDAQFTPVLLSGNIVLFDPPGDQSPASTDIVGNAQFPAAYYSYDGTNVFFRLRLNADPRTRTGGFDNFAWGLLFDTDGVPGTYEWLLAVNGLNTQVNLIQNVIKEFNSFNDPAEGLGGGTPNYSRPIINYDIARVRATGDGSNFGGNPDFFLDFFIGAATLFQFLGITDSSQIRLFFFTSANNNNYNKDSLLNNGFTFAQAFTPPVTIESSDVRAELAIAKTTISGPAQTITGEISTYTQSIQVSNTGKSTATTVFMTDVIGFDQVSSVQITGVSIGQATYDPSTQTISYNIGNLPAGQTATLTVTFSGQFTSTSGGTRTLNTALVDGIDSFTGNRIPTATAVASATVVQTGGIAGRVLDQSTGLPLPGAVITLQTQEGATVSVTSADAGGSYGFANIASGPYVLLTTRADYAISSQPVFVSPASVTTADILLQPLPAALQGTVSTGGVPIAGATVTVQDAFNVVVTQATTDPAGNYAISGLLPGNYTVVIAANAFQSAMTGVNLTPAETETVNISLSPNPALVTGTVLGADGSPIPGANVDIVDPFGQLVTTTTTDAAGNYAFNNLAPGSYRVRASAPNFSAAQVGVTLAAGEASVVNLILQPEPGVLTGIVHTAADTPLAGTSIRVVTNEGITIATAFTDSAGAFTIPSLPPNSYTVNFGQQGFASQTQGAIVLSNQTTVLDVTLFMLAGTLNGIVTDAGQVPQPGAVINVFQNNVIVATTTAGANGVYQVAGLAPNLYTVTAEVPGFSTLLLGAVIEPFETTTLNFALQPSPGGIGGTVTGTDGSPIAGAAVIVRQDSAAGPIVARTVTDSAGRYTIDNLDPGNYVLTASAEDFQTSVSGAIVQPNATAAADFVLAPSPGTISGVVVELATGAPIPNAFIEVRLLRANGIAVATGFTDASGNFAVDSLPPGSYTVIATAAGFQTNGATVMLEAAETENASIALLPNPGFVAGTVFNTATGLPLAGATVRIADANGFLYDLVVTDSGGAYTVRGLPPGNYIVSAFADGFQGQIIGAIVQSDTTSPVNLGLLPNPGAITGTVSPSSAGTLVQLLDANNVFILSVVTTAEGSYLFDNLAPGNYLIRATAANYSTETVGATVFSGQTSNALISLTPNPGMVSGRVTDAGGNPINTAEVKVFDANNVLLGVVLAGLNGEYAIGNLPAGNLTVVVSAPGFATAVGGVGVTPGENVAGLDFRLQQLVGSISGQITSAQTRQPVPGATIEVRILDELGVPVATVATSPFGNYLVENLAPGSYTVIVSAEGFAVSAIGVIVTANQTTSASLALSPLAGEIAGVVNAGGAILPGGDVSLRLYTEDGVLLQTLLANVDGSYRFFQVAPGNYIVNATADGFVAQSQQVPVAASQTATANFNLQSQPAVLSGIVRSEATGAALGGSTVIVRDLNDLVVATGIADENGAFALDNLPAGTFVAAVSAAGFGTGASVVNLNRGQSTSAVLQLVPNPGSLAGYVTDLDTSAAVEGAVVTVRRDDTDAVVATALTDNRGAYLIQDLGAGRYTVTAEASGFFTQILSEAVAPDLQTPLSFVLSRNPATIQGNVANAATGQPIAGAAIEIRLFNTFGEAVASSLTDAQGNYTINRVPASNYTVIASQPNFGTEETSAHVGPGQTTTLNFALTPNPASLSGTIVQQSNGLPIAGATIDVIDAFTGIVVRSGLSDARGVYLIGGLRADDYIVRTSQSGFQSESNAITLQPGSARVLNVSLRANPTTIVGAVTNTAQNVMNGAVVQVLNANNEVLAVTVTNPEGRFAVSGLPSETLVITTSSLMLGSAVVVFDPRMGGEVRISMPEEMGDLRGTVRDERLRPLYKALVEVFDRNRRLVRAVITNTAGQYYIGNLAAGIYDVQFTYPDKRPLTKSALIFNGQVTVLDAILQDDDEE
ncbi:carboxypeptidase regulatory-like domain-containing protein [Paenibacillus xanthanilyticus]|uniref:Carboxypeptidase regulatory-like domain-containing protein n=1 Tax=Paenibacillus xanthanilyticus TaxID=1783531 RepID=A0ABV8JWR7_9BACL